MSISSLESYEKINYLIRPSKQVERKLFIEALHKLGKKGYNISEYTYLGFGSIFYADFILFHKYLYINDMICVEAENIPNRMDFNKPYRFIRLEMKPVSDVLPTLNREKIYLVWLDYDCPFNREIWMDIYGFVSCLRPGSIFIITIEAEPKLPDSEENDRLSRREREDKLLAIYDEDFGSFLVTKLKRSNFSKNELPRLIVRIMKAHIDDTLIPRVGIEFFQFFNFIYADGAQMLTLGGMIEESKNKAKINDSDIYTLPYINRSITPLKISVPPLTIREKHWLDQNIKEGEELKDIKFELKENLLKNYIEYYKYYPQYYEAII